MYAYNHLSALAALSTEELNSLYYNPADLPLVYRTRADMARILQGYARQLAAYETHSLAKYMVGIRCAYLVNEVLADEHSELYKVLVGISYLAPHIIHQLIDDDALNIFLARDAATDYLAARTLADMGLTSAKATMLYISRNSLGCAYKITGEYVKRYGNSHGELYSALAGLFTRDSAFRESIMRLLATLREGGVIEHRRLRFIDSWAEGTLFAVIDFALYLHDNNKLSADSTNAVRMTPTVRSVGWTIAYYSTNTKTKLKVVKCYQDYVNVKYGHAKTFTVPPYFYEYYTRQYEPLTGIQPVGPRIKITGHQIGQWYRHAGISLMEHVRPGAFQELMSAKIFKTFNHFGSLNLGHPIEWWPAGQVIVESSADKKLGNYLRQMLMNNAVLGYRDGYDTGRISSAPDCVPPVVNRPNSAQLVGALRLSKAQSNGLSAIMYEHNEHFATCSSSALLTLINNTITTMDIFGVTWTRQLSRSQSYDFQYYINYIKGVDENAYRHRLQSLCNIYGEGVLKKMFGKNMFFFIAELEHVDDLVVICSKQYRYLVLDIDGTLTPLARSMPLLVKILETGATLAFITGRPRSFCQAMQEQFRHMLQGQYEHYAAQLFFYPAHGSHGFDGTGKDLLRQQTLETAVLSDIAAACDIYGLTIASQRDYRIILRAKERGVNPNRLRYVATQLDKTINVEGTLGISCVNWPAKSRQPHLLYNAIDICAHSKRLAFDNFATIMQRRDPDFNKDKVVFIGDEPDNGDRDLMTTGIAISVQGFGWLKTRVVLQKITGTIKT